MNKPELKKLFWLLPIVLILVLGAVLMLLVGLFQPEHEPKFWTP
jgi:hypothetical protein